jgi:hypothetical protein
MNGKCFLHLYKKNRSLNIIRALAQGATLFKLVQAKVQYEQKCKRKSAISVRAAKIKGTTFSFTQLAIGNVTVDEPLLVTQKIPSHLRAHYMQYLEILAFLCTCTQLWNQAHNCHS